MWILCVVVCVSLSVYPIESVVPGECEFSASLCLCVALYLSVSLGLSVCQIESVVPGECEFSASLSLSVSLCLSLSLCLSDWVCCALQRWVLCIGCVSLSLSLSQCLFDVFLMPLWLCVSLSLCLYVSMSLCFCVSVSLCLCVSVLLCFCVCCLSPSLYLSVFQIESTVPRKRALCCEIYMFGSLCLWTYRSHVLWVHRELNI